MAKGSNNFNSNRSHPYSKPYDSPNSSLVSRLTNRVTGMLPQPSGWLGRWLTPAEREQQNQLRNVPGEEDIVTHQRPPAKKLKLMPTTPNDVTIQLNHIHRESDLEISPIARDRPSVTDQADGAIAGPSGLQMRGPNFVASTPAILTSAEPPVKINGDEGSEGSETTSGCSSLVPQVERSLADPFQSTSPKSSEKFSNSSNSLGSRKLLLTTGNRSTIIPSSMSQKRPTFDIYAFNNPLNKSSSSLNSTLNNQSLQNDRLNSPFYRGRTMYGGSSSCVDSLNLSVIAASPKMGAGAKRICVRPTLTAASSTNQREISTVAEKILRAIEQFSSPVSDARKIPVRCDSLTRKRKAPPMPFEDLVIPTVPDLLRMKRKERAASESSAAATSIDSSSIAAGSSMAATGTPSAAPETSAVTSPSPATSSSPSISSKFYQLPPPVQPLSIRDDVDVNEKNVKVSKSESAEKIKLPVVSLPVPSLPSFRSSLPATATTSTRPKVSAVSSSAALAVSSASSAPTFTLSSLPASTTTSKPTVQINKKVNSETSCEQFKFSLPIECEKPVSAAAIKPSFKFREPHDANKLKSIQSSPVTNHLKSNFNTPPQPMNFPLKTKSPSNKKDSPIRTTPEKNIGSAANFFKSSKPVDKNSESLLDKFRPSSSNWTCDSCLVSNTADKTKCCCCETPKAGKKDDKSVTDSTWSCKKCSTKNKTAVDVCVCGTKRNEETVETEKSNSLKNFAKAPSDTWECSTCLVRNKSQDSKCVACSTMKAGTVAKDAIPSIAKDSALPLNALFKKDSKTWECSVCMVNNKAADSECIACGTKNPDAVSKSKPTSKFSFGIPSANPSLSTNSTATSSSLAAAQSFTFGIPQNEKTVGFKLPNPTNRAESPGFTFCNAKAEKINDESQKAEPMVNDKKVNFSTKEPETKENLNHVFSFSGAAKSTPESTSTTGFQFSVPKVPAAPEAGQKSIFGSTSNAASSSTDAKAIPMEKFGASSTGVSSTTDPAITSMASQVAPSSTNFSIFGQGQPPSNAPIFGVADTKPAAFSASLPTNLSAFPAKSESKPFSFKSGDGDEKSGLRQKDGKTSGLFGMPLPPASEAKTSLFGSSKTKSFFNSSESADSKNIFGGVKTDFGSSKPDFGAPKAEFGAAKPDFGAPKPTFDVEPSANEASGFNVFGSQTAAVNNTGPTEQPKTFGSSPFVFKGSETAPKAGGFSFPVQNSTPTNAFGFNTATETNNVPIFGTMGSQQAPPLQNVGPIFGGITAPIFNSTTQPQANAAPTPFAFGAQPQLQQIEQQPAFGFQATQPQAAATAFSFSAQNSILTPTPAQPPTFDPNIKPSFNFTGGATPSFAAPPSTSTEPTPQRKIRRAIRRTQQPR